MQEDTHVFQGMKLNTHPIKLDSNFLWEAHNIRLTNREDNTLFSITNEKGTKDTGLSFNGIYLGHCVLGKYLVVFTAERKLDSLLPYQGTSYIYRVEKNNDDTFTKVILFKGEGLLDPDYPIEAIGNVETEYVLKVYWVDGKHLPRNINIVKLEYLNIEYTNDEDVTSKLLYDKESFNFVRMLELNEDVLIEKKYGFGNFSMGVVLYALTYGSTHNSESNIFYISPLLYVSGKDRGGEKNETSNTYFNIKISNSLKEFEYINLYSIYRTSLNAVPTVKLVSKIQITDLTLEYEDFGNSGSTVDNNLLFYIGGLSIIPKNIISKDNTLFLSNYKFQNFSDILKIKTLIGYDENTDIITTNYKTFPTKSAYNDYYAYVPNLDLNCSYFKSGHYYMLGVLLLDNYGKWSDPIVIKKCYQVPENNKPNIQGLLIQIPTLRLSLSNIDTKQLIELGYKKIRGVVYTEYNTGVIALGLLCPTVYNYQNRIDGLVSSQSSWFFRPNIPSSETIKTTSAQVEGAWVESRHGYLLANNRTESGEIQSNDTIEDIDIETINDLKHESLVGKVSDRFVIDLSILTLHSPDIEFNNFTLNKDANLEVRLVGITPFNTNVGDVSIKATATALSDARGFENRARKTLTLGGRSSVAGPFFDDGYYAQFYDPDVEGEPELSLSKGLVLYLIYPWLKSGTIINLKKQEGESLRAELQTKKISNLKFSNDNIWLNSAIDQQITDCGLWGDGTTLLKIRGENYLGNVDTLVYRNVPYHYVRFLNDKYDIIKDNLSTDAIRMKYKSTPHVVVALDSNTKMETILPVVLGTHSTLTNINRYEKKILPKYRTLEAIIKNNVHYPCPPPAGIEAERFCIRLLDNYKAVLGWTYTSGDPNLVHFEPDWGYSYPKKGDVYRVFLNNKWEYYRNEGNDQSSSNGEEWFFRYKDITEQVNYTGETTFVKLLLIPISSFVSDFTLDKGYLFIAELYNKLLPAFSLYSEYDIINNISFYPAGSPVTLDTNNASVNIDFSYGDTWYQRYDCLKTYPFTSEDENQIVEIGSFMCETRVNIDGRYDRNRGLLSNLNMTPQNFNLINDVYSLKDNFFTYRILPKDFYKQDTFKSQITWSKEKMAGEEVDTWTNITLANTLDLDGSKGEITAIKPFNELLVAFQEQAVNKINFNSRVLIPTSDGVPIEITNSYKVDGYDTYSNIIGCQDKNSIINTEEGIYFIDNNSNSLYKFNGQLTNVSDTLGMKSWFKDNKFNYKWRPIPGALNKNNGIRSFYDYENGDIYFTPGWNNIDSKYTTRDALCYSNKLLAFSSLMSYGGTLAMFNYCGDFYSLRYNPNESEEKIKLYLNNAGDYNDFYGETKGWDFSFISNDGSAVTKVFDTLELRTDVYNSSKELLNSCPMNFIKADNEYLNTGEVTLDRKNMRKKFRIWRSLIPRNKGTRERIRNPWTKITLGWNPLLKQESENSNNSAIIHDVTVRYTV